MGARRGQPGEKLCNLVRVARITAGCSSSVSKLCAHVQSRQSTCCVIQLQLILNVLICPNRTTPAEYLSRIALTLILIDFL